MTKKQIIAAYDPNGIGNPDHIFGLPFDEKNSEVVLIPVPWEVTVSYNSGTVEGANEVFNASLQVDLFDASIKDAWQLGIFMPEGDQDWADKSYALREEVESYITWLEEGEDKERKDAAYLAKIPAKINKECKKLNDYVEKTALALLKKDKMVGLVGGDHSTPLGFMKALATKHEKFAILQIDAHCDLRDAYEDFEFSHASIMHNALKMKHIEKLVQVGIRDYCEEEYEYIQNSKGRVKTFFDKNIKHQMYEGKTWSLICDEIIAELPQNVYISFDIDGLDPKLCPNTGTPVAGGFELEQMVYLFTKMVGTGKKIVGFDLVEVASDDHTEWDGNVGARLLYKLCNLMAVSQGKLKFN